MNIGKGLIMLFGFGAAYTARKFIEIAPMSSWGWGEWLLFSLETIMALVCFSIATSQPTKRAAGRG